MKKSLLCIGILVLLPLQLDAQKLWTLEECIHYAWDNNLTIKQQELSVEQTENQLFQSKMDLAPNLNASLSTAISWGRSVDLNTLKIIDHVRSTQVQGSISSSWDLFTGLKKFNTIKQRIAQMNISKQDVQTKKNDISIEITRAFLNCLLAQEVYETARQSLASVQEQCDRTRKLVDAGSQPMSNLLELEAQLATENVQLIEAENTIRTNTLALKQTLDLSMDNDFAVAFPQEVTVEDFQAADVEELYYISQNLPQIKKAEYTLEQKRRELKIAQGGRYPTLQFQAAYSTFFSDDNSSNFLDTTQYTFFEQLKKNVNPNVGIALQIPIFNQWQVNTSIKNARIGVSMAELEKRNTEQVLFKEIQQAANEALSSYQRCYANAINVKSMEESFRYVQQKFDIGLLNGTDYTVSKTNLFKAQSDYIQAKYQHVFNLKILDFYRGIPITM